MTIWELTVLVCIVGLLIVVWITYTRAAQAEYRANNVSERCKQLEDGLGSVTRDLIGELKKK